jgi:bla regulator protein blaR1
MFPTRKATTKGLAALFVAIVLTVPQLPAQSSAAPSTVAPERPAFDVASVKVSQLGPASSINLGKSGGHLAIIGFSLQQLMAIAYNLPSLSQAVNAIIGLPQWGATERFDIDAEAPGNPSVAQKRVMLQSLLADRFKLAIHHETRQLPVYALVMVRPGKLGPQLHPHTEGTPCEALPAGQSGAPSKASPNASSAASPAEVAAVALQQFPCGRIVGNLLAPNDHNQVWSGGRKVTTDNIAASLGTMEYIDRPVVNRTDLSGDFDFTVEWDNRNEDDLIAGPQSDQLGPSLFEALRDQLGLKVDSQKGPVDVLVIDHVEQPTGN